VQKTPEQIADEILAKHGTSETRSTSAGRPKPDGPDGVSLDDFRAYMPTHSYIYMPMREMWPASSVNARVPPVLGLDGKSVAPSGWLAQHRAVEQMTWAPGLPMLVPSRLVDDGGWIEHVGVTCFNLYRPPTNRRLVSDISPSYDLSLSSVSFG
jgi:hypothetical protein